MAVRSIVLMGNPKLLETSQAITEFDTPELHTLIADMFDTMEQHYGIGLAAPQIGVQKRIVIFQCHSNPRYPNQDDVPKTILINPEITALTKETQPLLEGCLSLPGLRGLVQRPTKIHYHGVDPYGKEIVAEVTGIHARIVQHECDHLDGILYPMRMKDLTSFGFEVAM